MESLILAQD